MEITGPRHTTQVWRYIQRDHALGGKCYMWIESEQDVEKYITKKPKSDLIEIDYLIFKNDDPIGSFHIHNINYSDRNAEIGYAIEKRKEREEREEREEGKGYVSEAFSLIESEMKRLGFNKLIIKCSTDNIRSIKFAERNGFSSDSILVQDCVGDGKFRDTVVFGKLLKVL